MPLVIVNRNAKVIPDDVLKPILKRLTHVVAEALNIPNTDSSITGDDIEIWLRDARPGGLDVDPIGRDVQVVIFAHSYTDRIVNLDERQAKITSWLKDTLPPQTTGFVWVILAPTSFDTFVAK